MNPESPAPAPVRFDCPACHAVLTVPAAAAGLQGPCPKCWQEIVSPDPARGLPARLPSAAPPAIAPPAPSEPPAPAAPAALPEPEPEPLPPVESVAPATPAAPEVAPDLPPARTARRSRGIGWLIPTFLCSAIFTAVGFHLGKSQRQTGVAAAPVTPVAALPDIPKPAPEPSVVPATPPGPETPPEPVVPAPPPDPARPTAEATLRAFLEAPDWKTRGDRVLDPDVILPALEKYAAQAGDGPFADRKSVV